MSIKIPITIFTGILGSGKTTIISNLAQQNTDFKIALIVNEYGNTSIDSIIFKKSNNGNLVIHEINDGLIAYAGNDDFENILKSIITDKYQIDHIIIETSGLAVPSAIWCTLENNDYFNSFFIDATIAVIDTPLLLAGYYDTSQVVSEILIQQLSNSDIAILNKVDNLNEPDLALAEKLIRKKANKIRFIELAYHGNIDLELALGLNLHTIINSKTDNYSTKSIPTSLNGHSHSNLEPHDHGLLTHEHIHEHDPSWLSFMLTSDEKQDFKIIESALNEVINEENIFRVKGYILTSNAKIYEFQSVPNRIYTLPIENLPCLIEQSQLVFIGRDIDRHHIEHRLSDLTSTHWR